MTDHSDDEKSAPILEDTTVEDAAPADEASPTAEAAPPDASPTDAASTPRRMIGNWSSTAIFVVIPALALILALAAGWLAYVDHQSRRELDARKETVQVAKDSTVALLSYEPDKVERQLKDARDRLTGAFKDQYVDLTTNVVIPGAKQKQISAVATVPQAASVSATDGKAVVLVFINQTVVVGGDAPTSTASSVRVTLDKVGNAWLISKFDPV